MVARRWKSSRSSRWVCRSASRGLLSTDERDLVDVPADGDLGLLTAVGPLARALVLDDLAPDARAQREREADDDQVDGIRDGQDRRGHAPHDHRQVEAASGRASASARACRRARQARRAARARRPRRRSSGCRSTACRSALPACRSNCSATSSASSSARSTASGRWLASVAACTTWRCSQTSMSGQVSLRVAGLDDRLDVAQDRAQPLLQVVLDVGDQVLDAVGQHLLPASPWGRRAGAVARAVSVEPATTSSARAGSVEHHAFGLGCCGRAGPRRSRPRCAAACAASLADRRHDVAREEVDQRREARLLVQRRVVRARSRRNDDTGITGRSMPGPREVSAVQLDDAAPLRVQVGLGHDAARRPGSVPAPCAGSRAPARSAPATRRSRTPRRGPAAARPG